VRFIGGGLAPYAAGRLVVAVNIHFPFYLGAGAVLLGIVILSTGHKLLAEAERVQAEDVKAAAAPAAAPVFAPAAAPAFATVGGNSAARRGKAAEVLLVAIDGSQNADLVTDAAARLAADDNRVIHLVHAQESPVAGDGGIDGEALEAARAVVRDHLDRLAASGVPAEGHVLLHANDHGTAGRLIAEYANEAGATTILIGAPANHGLSALMDESASAELRRHTKARVLVIDPDVLSS
jgi:nucleotide-binding universal stress UspA family protein